MKKHLTSALFFAAVFTMAIGCQSKKTESDEAKTDTTTVIENDTLVKGDTTLVETDTAKIVSPDSTK